ncbi:WRKY transcription factor 44 [Tanacetum coccineum]|uniref:WRKY transcription factor 44 n=1 Tax=Tanacetum coccineum TaxID=301880 RepID=A0ABQ5IJ35_9ASTR
MELKEGERIVVAKPVASRPTLSNFKSFSVFVPGDTNGSPTSEPIITAIRPKTVRFKPVRSSPLDMVSSQAELAVTQACHSSGKILKTNHTPPLLYKPLAKTVSKATISMLANMGTCNASHEQALVQNIASQSEMVKINLPNSTPVKSGNDKKPQLYRTNNDRPSYDGYNWRKYGQKQVKGSEYPRSYYKCTHPNCVVKKKVERSLDGDIAEIVYKGDHNHVKPRLPRRHAFDGTSQDSNCQLPNNQIGENNEHIGSSSHLNNLVKAQESYDRVSNEALNASIPNFDCSCGVARIHNGSSSKVIMENVDDIPAVKRRKGLNQLSETFVEGLQEPQVVIHDGPDSEAISDGFRWRKYGQKVVRGNPHPRSYYRCTGIKCNVRKHVERASDDSNVFITTYEGKHNHEMPIKKAT